MIRGRFGGTSGRPYVEGLLVFPRQGLRSHISFLVDTGADRTVLHPADGARMGVNYATLQGNVTSVGVGGTSQSFAEDAMVVFAEHGHFLYVYRVQMWITPPNEHIMDLPSLLGRDILDRWRMVYHPAAKYLAFEVITADESIPIT